MARLAESVSQNQLAREVGWSASAIGRLETGQRDDIGVVEVAELASVLGLEMSIGLHPLGDPLRDKGQLACARRFDDTLSERWHVTDEMLLPGPGERRAWDKLLRLLDESPRYLVGVDIESRVWDVQLIVRRTRQRERDGRVDHILIVLADTAHNRRIAQTLRESLGKEYATHPRTILRQLRVGKRLTGSGVILV